MLAWLRGQGPELADVFDVRQLQNLPPPVAREAARRWLAARTRAEVPSSAAQQLVEMANDAATPPRQHFPGALLVSRSRGKIFIEPRTSFRPLPPLPQ
jgi:hypothetical protein